MDSNCSLTDGALSIIMNGGEVKNPVLQVLGSKKMATGKPDSERYRMLLSDGKYTINNAMLTTSINSKFGGHCITDYSVVKVTRFLTTVLNNTGKADNRVLLIMDGELLIEGKNVGEKLGDPSPLNMAAVQNESNSSSNGKNMNANGSTSNYSSRSFLDSNSTGQGNSLCSQVIHPISSLSPYQNKWVIKARVTNKSAIRTWSNSRGEGKLFNFDMIDESGEIRCTCFKDAVDKFYDKIEIDKVYYISKCQLKPANKQFSTVKNEYEMTATNDTIIEECLDTDSSNLPQTKYDFVPIDKIAQVDAGTLIDIIGVVKQVGELATFQAKSTGRELKKREVILTDPSRTSITFTLWGADAETFTASNNPVLVIKCAKVGEFGGGKNISTIAGSHIKINPELQESYRMRSWYDSEGKNIDPVNISASSGGMGNFQTSWLSFNQVQEKNLGQSDKGDYYQNVATVLLVRSENSIYKACPGENCNKKVVDMENGMYRCEKCNREFTNFKYRLLLSMNVADWSGNQWVSMFSSEAEKILGMTAEEVGRQLEDNPDAMREITDKANFKQFTLKCRAKIETYNDEARLKTVAIKVDPINHEEFNSHLIEKINDILSVSN